MSPNSGPQAKSSLPVASVNKVLQEHSHIYLFMLCSLFCAVVQSRVLARDFGMQSLKYLLSVALQKKFANPCCQHVYLEYSAVPNETAK